MVYLKGSGNPTIKEVRSLKSKSGRDDKGLYFIEGVRFVSEALKQNAAIQYLVMSEAFVSAGIPDEMSDGIGRASLKCYVVPDSIFDSISDTRTPQGVLAVLRKRMKQLGEAKLARGFFVILDDIKDPGNMGTIIRTADAAGCAGVIIPDGCVDAYNPKVLRSTMGSIFNIPIYHCATIAEAMKITADNGFLLCASHINGPVSIYEADLSGDVALIIGSEADGVGIEASLRADMLVTIPMAGGAESLNAAVAAGIIIFEAMRQKMTL